MRWDARLVAGEEDMATAWSIRRQVFVLEQSVPAELEVDGLDATAQHFLAFSGEQPVAAARARASDNGWKLERVAVLAAHRGRAVGTALVRCMLRHAPAGVTVYVHAQSSALGFWRRLGFVVRGPEFYEAGIPHRVMVLERSGEPAATA